MNRLFACRAGNTALEFAVILPVVVLVLFGTLTAGLYLGVASSVQALAADVARAGVEGTYDWECERSANSFVASNASGYFMVDPERVVASVSREHAESRMVVSVTYDASWLPVWSLSGLLPMPDPVITRTAIILGHR